MKPLRIVLLPFVAFCLLILFVLWYDDRPRTVAAQGTATPYDCTFTYHFTGSTTSTGQPNASASRPCIAWRVTFSTTGFASATVQFETSPDNSTWAAVTNSICSSSVQPPCVSDGANPITAGKQGTGAYRAYGKYVRINITGVSGSGTGDVIVYGYKGTSANAGTGPGGGVPGPSGPSGPAGGTGPSGPSGPGIGPGASAYNSSTQTLPFNAVTPLTFDTNSWDTGSIHSTSINPTRFTAPTTGYYLANCGVINITPTGILTLLFQINGSTPGNSLAGGYFPNISGANAGNISQVFSLTSGDYLECAAVSAIDAGGGSTQANNSWLQLTKLSATF